MATLSEEAQPRARPAERRGKAGDVTVALAVRKSASWLMLETSGELFMMTRMRDRGSETPSRDESRSRSGRVAKVWQTDIRLVNKTFCAVT